MFLAKGCRLAALDVKARPPRRGIMGATLVGSVYHAVRCMLLAVCGRPAALDVETRDLRARVMRATLVGDVNHVVISMLLAVDRCLAPVSYTHLTLPTKA